MSITQAYFKLAQNMTQHASFLSYNKPRIIARFGVPDLSSNHSIHP